MPWGGVLLVGVGLWICTQVLAGNALGRLGIAGAGATPGATGQQRQPEPGTWTGRNAGAGG